jgi:hypothetical protein
MDHARAISVPSRSSACDPHKGGSNVVRPPPYLRSPWTNEPASAVSHAQGGCGRAIGRCGVPYEYLDTVIFGQVKSTSSASRRWHRHREKACDRPPFSPGVSQPGSMRPRASKAPMKRIPPRSLLGRRVGVSRWAEARPSYDRILSRNTRDRIPLSSHQLPSTSVEPKRELGPSAMTGRCDGQQAILAHGSIRPCLGYSHFGAGSGMDPKGAKKG